MSNFRVMTFNVRGARHDDGANRWDNRRDLNVATIQKYAPSIIGFQEAQPENIATYKQTLTHHTLAQGLHPPDARHESLPIYYAPKWLFGKKSLKGFVRGALGMHMSKYERSGDLPDINVSDLGAYLGISAGAMFMFSQKWFANIEYEWAYLSNSYYRDGEVGSAMIGLGFRY